MSPFQIPEGPYTIEEVMESIRTQIVNPAQGAPGAAGAGNGDGGTPAPNPIGPDAPEGPRPLIADGGPLSGLMNQLELMRQRQWLDPGYRIHSHRPVFGRLLDLVKRVIHWGARPYTDLIRARQEAFNEAALHALREISLQLEDSLQLRARRQAHLEAQFQRMERGITELFKAAQARQREWQDHLRNAYEEMNRLEREQAKRHEDLSGHLKNAYQWLEGLQSEQIRQRTEQEEKHQGLDGRLGELDGRLAELAGRHDLGPFFAAVPDHQRLAIMDQTRGSFDDISARQSFYGEMFLGAPGPVLDVGCGRGELLGQLRERGIEGRGVDVDPLMVRVCRERGLAADQVDALSALRAAEPASLGGIFAAQVVEHFFPGELLAFLRLARERLAPGGRIVLETVNPASLGVLAKSWFRDIDHKQPIHGEYLRLLLELAGFEETELHYASPFRPDEQLPELPPAGELGAAEPAREPLQKLINRLEAQIYGMQDYYVKGQRSNV